MKKCKIFFNLPFFFLFLGWVQSTNLVDGKIFIITGANVGIGFETARALVKRHATVIFACRDLVKAQEAMDKIREETIKGEMFAIQLDLGDFTSIRNCAKEILERFPKFDCLINNAGLIVKTEQLTKEGIEILTGVNHIGPFLLTNLLLENIKMNTSRVVVVSSESHEKGTINFETFGKFNPAYAKEKHYFDSYYADSKLMNFYFAKELYKQGIDAHICSPGFCKTQFFREYKLTFFEMLVRLPDFYFRLKSAEQGAQNIIHCALDNINTKEINPDKSYMIFQMKPRRSPITLDDKISERLWNESAKLCGLI
jgi:NAD(P)-dependent dehydrogenase (short-subunit alcohol dehydrogenase family)